MPLTDMDVALTKVRSVGTSIPLARRSHRTRSAMTVVREAQCLLRSVQGRAEGSFTILRHDFTPTSLPLLFLVTVVPASQVTAFLRCALCFALRDARPGPPWLRSQGGWSLRGKGVRVA